jgi:ABC-type proline/glycine betaine transport system permease subunit
LEIILKGLKQQVILKLVKLQLKRVPVELERKADQKADQKVDQKVPHKLEFPMELKLIMAGISQILIEISR